MMIVPFEPRHIDLYDGDGGGLDLNLFREVADTWVGNAVSVVHEDEVLGICGVTVQNDEATVSMLLSDGIRTKPMFLHRGTVRGIEALKNFGVKTIRANCKEGDLRAMKWLKRLGFSPGGQMEINGTVCQEFIL